MYERPSTEQLQAVSKVITTPNSSFVSEVRQVSSKVVEVVEKHDIVKEKKDDFEMFGARFSGLDNCSIQFSPQTMVVNIQKGGNI